MEHVSLEELQDGIVVLTIDRPDRRNALSNKVLAELHEAVDRIGSDPAIRVVIRRGRHRPPKPVLGDAWCCGRHPGSPRTDP